MPDIATIWQPAEGRGDWALAGHDLAGGRDLETSLLISLFSDRRADADDEIPDGSADRRGWWGDTGRDRPLGSKLWLLERAKQTEETRLAAEDYCQEALAWLVDEGIADSVAVEASWQRAGFLGIRVTVAQPDGSEQTFNFQWAWQGVS